MPTQLSRLVTNRPPPGGHAAIARIFRIHARLAGQRPVTAQGLASELEVSERTIKRDIECMRDRCQSPIAWDAAKRTYRYTQPSPFLPILRLEADEALALVLASATFAAWKGTPLGTALSSAFGKFSQIAGSHVSLPTAQMSECLFRADDPAPAAEHRHFAQLIEEIVRRRELTLHYRKPHASKAEIRTVQPLHLAYLDHGWMLIACDTAKRAWRNFLVSRIESLAPTGRSFTPPPREEIHRYLGGSMGRFTGENEIVARLRFDPTAAPYVRERPWHTSQVLTELPGGAVEITLKLNNLIDLQRRVLACGRHVEVLAPLDFRENLRQEAEAMVVRFGA